MSKPNNTQLADIASYMAQSMTVPQLVQHYDKSMIFSTDEVMVGQWIDNRPIYKKSVAIGSLPNKTTKVVSHGISNIREVVGLYGIGASTSSWWMLPWAFSGNNTTNNDTLNVYVTATDIQVQACGDASSESISYVTVWYTKTTDDPVDYVPVGGCDPQFQSATTFDQNNPTNCIIRYTSGDGEQLLDADSLLLYQKSASTPESTADYIAVNTAKYTYDLFNTITVDSSAGFMNMTPLQNIPMKIVFSKNSIATRVIYGSIPVILLA